VLGSAHATLPGRAKEGSVAVYSWTHASITAAATKPPAAAAAAAVAVAVAQW